MVRYSQRNECGEEEPRVMKEFCVEEQRLLREDTASFHKFKQGLS